MSALYLLDTNIVSALVRDPHGAVAHRALKAGESRLCTSIIVACELRFGAVKSGSARLAAQLDAVLGAIPVFPLEAGVDGEYATVRLALERRGAPIGQADLLIASHARQLGAVLVTENRREFERVPGLRVESWAPRRT